MEIAITSYHLVVGLGLVGLSLAILIFALRHYFNQRLKTKENLSWSSRTKYGVYDVFKYSGTFFRAGMICALLITMLAFNYTQFDYVHVVSTFEPDEIIEEVTPPIIYPEPKPIPPPPKSAKDNQIIEIVEAAPEPVFVEEVVTVDVETTPEAEVTSDVPVAPVLPDPPPVLPPSIELDDDPVLMAESMPRMCTSCDTKNISRAEKNTCATTEMLRFVQAKLKYPTLAREVGVQGMCPVRFIVRKDGSISDIELQKG